MLIGIDASRASKAERTGTEAYAYHLIRALLPLAVAEGHIVRLYYNQPPAQPISDIPHHTVTIGLPRLWTHLRLAAELQRRPPAVFFTPAHFIPISYYGPSVATIHDLGYHYFPEAHTKSQLRQLRWSTRHNARRSRLVLADSEATKADLATIYEIAEDKVEVAYPAYDNTLQPVDNKRQLAEVRGKYRIKPPYFLFLSTLQPRKNVARIIEAFADVAAAVPESLVLAGNQGWLAEPLLQQIEALPDAVRQRVCLPGFIDEADKAALLSGATALVYPSLYEGFGFPILEAQACGTAVLTSANSSLPEVAGDGAWIVSAESVSSIKTALRGLSKDSTYRSDLVAKGFRNLQRFSWQQTAQEVLATLVRASTMPEEGTTG